MTCLQKSRKTPLLSPSENLEEVSPLFSKRRQLEKMVSSEDGPKKFWSRVQMAEIDQCWNWTGHKNGPGYGKVFAKRWPGDSKTYNFSAHRLAYIYAYGMFPQGLLVCHHCDNPSCCNPAHLFLGTDTDNSADKVAKGRHARGENHGFAKLTEDNVRDILHRFYNLGERAFRIKKVFGVSRGTIRDIVQGITWRHLDISSVRRAAALNPKPTE